MVSLVRALNMRGIDQRVITGRPRKETFPTAVADKTQWVKEHIGDIFDVIVCLARDKQKYVKRGTNDILVDDREDNIERWRNAGGVGVLHKNYTDTYTQLINLLNT